MSRQDEEFSSWASNPLSAVSLRPHPLEGKKPPLGPPTTGQIPFSLPGKLLFSAIGLFDQGRLHLTESRVKTAALGTEKTKDDVIRQVVEAVARVRSMADQYAAATRAVQLAQEGLRLTQERKEFAVGAVLEDIQAQQDLTQSRLELVNALAEYNKAQYALQLAIGALR